MNCKSFIELSPPEQQEYIGKLVVAVQRSETFFMAGKQIVDAAEEVGVFRKVKVGQEVFDGVAQVAEIDG